MSRDDESASSPAEPPSPDLLAIQRKTEKQLQRDRMWTRSAARDPDLAAALKLSEEIEFLAEMLNGGWSTARRRQRIRALRILVRRFGRLGAKHIINLTADVSMLDLRLTLAPRTDKERHDRGWERRRIDREIEDARLLSAVHRYREDGMADDDAIFAAAKEVLGRVSGGIAGAKKAMTRARTRAIQRKYVDPFGPFVATLMGGHVCEPKIKVADLRGPGRPKITTTRK